MIKNQLLGLYHYLRQKIQNLWYYKETMSLIAETKCLLQLPELPRGKYLVLIPHSDDEWIGNSTLLVNKKYQVQLFDMDMPGDDTAVIHQKRYAEMKEIAKRYERTLHSKKEGTVLNEVIAEYKPDYVTVPYYFDWHPEHREVMLELRKAISFMDCCFKVAMYQVSVPIACYNITHMNTMDKKISQDKWHVFRDVYRSQGHFPAYRVACHERINGKMADVYSCESFCVMGCQEWVKSFDNMVPNEDEISEIKARVGSIKGIRAWIQKEVR